MEIAESSATVASLDETAGGKNTMRRRMSEPVPAAPRGRKKGKGKDNHSQEPPTAGVGAVMPFRLEQEQPVDE